MDVYDADEGFITDSADFLGRCKVHIKDIIESITDIPDCIPIPKWYDVKYGTDESSPACGKILCSFALLEPDHESKPIKQAVE